MEWITTYGPRFVWPAMIVVGVVLMAITWKVASAIYEQVSGIAAGAVFLVGGLCLLLYCAYNLIGAEVITNGMVFTNGVGIMAAIGLAAAGGFGIRNGADF